MKSNRLRKKLERTAACLPKKSAGIGRAFGKLLLHCGAFRPARASKASERIPFQMLNV
jgi:hypothetical protein